ncbi:MAG TPA: N-acetylmuramoyl-L-alanine amidase, partial [Chthoniobacterales bacterium]
MNRISTRTRLPHLRSRLARLLACLGFVLALSLGHARAQSRIIVLDAGHGGHDRGGVPRQRIGEKGMTLDVAQRLRRVLEASGYRVIMTRNSDVFVSLGERVAIANSYRNATFVSVHFNSAPRSGANGIETYYYRGDSASLAANIHRHVVANAPSENRGIRRRGYFVLRRTRIPSV